MLERPQKVLRLACLIFGAVLVCQFALLIKRGDPLNRLTIPQVPTLASAAETNSPASKGSEKKGANAAASKDLEKKGTNAPTSTESAKTATNGATAKGNSKAATNLTTELAKGSNSSTNQTAGKNGIKATDGKKSVPEANETNTEKIASVKEPEKAGTDASKSKAQEGATNAVSNTNSLKGGTNLLASEKDGKGTNSISKSGTNSPSGKEVAKKGGPRSRGEPGKVPDDLPPLIKGRIERITMSEILGQIVRPMPMALLGIADKDVFLRAPDGQTGMIKVGGELGGVKLLQIGTNRILIEHEGQKKELTLFSGLGSETLMPKTTDKTNETTNKTP